MRQVLIDHARKEQAAKRGGLAITLSLEEASDHAPAEETDLDLLALDDAMSAWLYWTRANARSWSCDFLAGSPSRRLRSP